MKKRLSLGVLFLLVGITAILPATGQDRSANGNIRQRFVGAWRLVWLEDQGSDGKIHRADSTGQLVFTSDGHISIQVMYRNPQPDSKSDANAAPVQYAQGGYEASFGTYEIDEHAHTFIYRVEGALVRTLIGKDLPRAFEFSGKQLIVKSTNPDEHWRVAWERY